jgi:hypothetical protein
LTGTFVPTTIINYCDGTLHQIKQGEFFGIELNRKILTYISSFWYKSKPNFALGIRSTSSSEKELHFL